MKETICKLWREGQTLKNRETTQDTLTRALGVERPAAAFPILGAFR